MQELVSLVSDTAAIRRLSLFETGAKLGWGTVGVGGCGGDGRAAARHRRHGGGPTTSGASAASQASSSSAKRQLAATS